MGRIIRYLVILYYLPFRFLSKIKSVRIRIWKSEADSISLRTYKEIEKKDFLNRISLMLGKIDWPLFSNFSNDDVSAILNAADGVTNGKYEILGAQINQNIINWHTDYISGYKWHKQFYTDIKSASGSDIKYPWEMSRCHHLLWLSEAYIISGNEKYAQRVVDDITWWIEDNPFMYSVNWKCSMEVAIRSINWIYAVHFISNYKGLTDSFIQLLSRSLWQHGFFIWNNLEKVYPSSNNHYVSDLVGLLYIGGIFNKTSLGHKWLRKSFREFKKEIKKQVLDTGVDYEKSISYHRLMTELLSYPMYMLKRIGYSVDQSLLERITKMYAFVSNYIKPNGLAPLIADNDDGRLLPFVKRDFRDHRYLNDSDSVENQLISMGMMPFFCYSQNVEDDILYHDAGIAISRNNDNYLLITNSGYSKVPNLYETIISTHTHNDYLSFELSLKGKDVIVDSGSYVYTSSKENRDAFRCTAKHNTVVVDEEEQNYLWRPFYLKRNSITMGLTAKNGVYSGEYCTIRGALKHRRSFSLSSNELITVDTVRKMGGEHIAKMYFHVAPEFNAVVENFIVNILDSCDTFVTIHFDVKPNTIDVVDDTVSPSYGVLNKSKTIIASFHFYDIETITTHISLS